MTQETLANMPTSTPLAIDDFSAFYEAVHSFPPFEWQTRLAEQDGSPGHNHDRRRLPFEWQTRLAEQVCLGSWPDFIKLPTSSGKTSVIDIAIFALAFQACEQNRPEGKITAARRIFFVVDRRIIVNEAYLQTRATAQKLWDAVSPDASNNTPEILRQVGTWLRTLSADAKAPPLDCHELRGGIYRDDAWVRSPLQPTVLASTVDQIGSRLLFRGYGVSDRNLPIHAALTANDSLIILDEAHCSKPFSQTLDSVSKYRSDRWAQQPVDSPFSFVQMTATPPVDLQKRKLFELDDQLDYEKDELLRRRHSCSKPVSLIEAKGAKGKPLADKLAKKLVEHARKLASEDGCKRIAIIVNRVAIAKAAYKLLQAKRADDSSLMIGRMRPIDRETLTKDLQENFRSGSDATIDDPKFVVATQCLEVGADFDFDGMVCQCASLDALRQRFGRLNRLGDSDHARAVIVAAEGDLQDDDKLKEDKPLDPIYGNAIARTWNWLSENASSPEIDVESPESSGDSAVHEEQDNESRPVEIDFGIRSMDALLVSQIEGRVEQLTAPAGDAPVLMPAHVEMLCQTSPRPKLEPDVAAYLHGPDRGMPEVRVCWRADLEMNQYDPTQRLASNLRLQHSQNWIDAVAQCPPTSSECLNVPLHVFRKWLSGEPIVDQTSDVLGEQVEKESDSKRPANRVVGRCALVWRGTQEQAAAKRRKRKTNGKEVSVEEASILVNEDDVKKIRPNDTIVVPAEFGGWNELGFIPGNLAEPDIKELAKLTTEKPDANEQEGSGAAYAAIDVADQAFCQSRARTILRVHPKFEANAGDLRGFFGKLLNTLTDREADLSTGVWKEPLRELKSEPMLSNEDQVGDPWKATNSDWGERRIKRLLSLPGKLVRYPGGVAWTTGLHEVKDRMAGMPPLPLDSFGDDNDSLSQTGRVKLMQHLADVHDEVCRLTGGTSLPNDLCEVLTSAAKLHDIGKADPRFQAMLLNKPLSVAFMQSTLWAKSDFRGGGISNDLPQSFRHEMLSLDLLDRFESGTADYRDLLSHLVASHHGYARPLAPICLDDAKPGFRLDEFSCAAVSHDEREGWSPAHRLDSGVSERFWTLNRQFGWWGLALLETTLRLADWNASANPGHGDLTSLSFSCVDVSPKPSTRPSPLVLSGIDGSKPLGFLAALGVFRLLDRLPENPGYRFAWTQNCGAWRPTIYSNANASLTDEGLLDVLIEHLESDADQFPALRLAELEGNRRDMFQRIADVSDAIDRDDADWLSCNGSDAIGADAISQLQTSRKDYHPKSIRRLVCETTYTHLQRSLFEPWDYSDPIAGISLHIEPREDRRHAYQWNTPSGDPTSKIFGGMIGANRLALEAWPLFQSLPADDKLATVGFTGLKANDTRLTWPVWTTPIPVRVILTVLALRSLQQFDLCHDDIDPIGIAHVYRCSRILVGKTPNLTTASPAMV